MAKCPAIKCACARRMHLVEIMEIWANDARTEFAAKTSGNSSFLITTDPDAKYTHIIYAAPYLGRRGATGDDDDDNGVRKKQQLQLELERQRQRYENGGELDWSSSTYTE